MACDPAYQYLEIFETYGAIVRNLVLTDNGRPFPTFETRTSYDGDSSSYKGLLVWHAQRYYTALEETTSTGDYTNDIGFFVVPHFGHVSIVSNVEFKQMVVITFDSNSSLDYDPYGSKIIEYINWFINANQQAVETWGNEMILPSNSRQVYTRLEAISEPIYVPSSSYVRRSVTLGLRYCQCG